MKILYKTRQRRGTSDSLTHLKVHRNISIIVKIIIILYGLVQLSSYNEMPHKTNTFSFFLKYLSQHAHFVCLKNVNKALRKMTIFLHDFFEFDFGDSITQNTILLFEKGSLGNYSRMFGALICIILRKQMVSLCGGVLLPEYLER